MVWVKKEAKDASGFTLVELAISIVVLSILLVSVMSLLDASVDLLGDVDVETSVELESGRASAKLLEVLRETGRTQRGGVEYPRVINGGSGLEFLLPADLDGNGYAFREGSDDVEWHPSVYQILADGGGALWILRDGVRVYQLARQAEDVRFETIYENNTLELQEVRTSFVLARPLRAGGEVTRSIDMSVQMRN